MVKFASWGWIEIVAGALRRQEARGERSCAILFMNERTVLQLHGQQRQKKERCMYIWDKICEREEREARKRTGRNEDQKLCGWRERDWNEG